MDSQELFSENFPHIIQDVQDMFEQTEYRITPNIIQKTRKKFPQFSQDIISKLLDIACNSLRAQSKIEYASIMPWYFTEQTLMQSSEPAFADHIMNRLNVKGESFIEICTGSGMHTYSALKHGAKSIVTHELDPFISSLANMNLGLHGFDIKPLIIDGGNAEISSEDIMWADPSRRTSGKERKTLTGIYAPDIQQLIVMAEKAKRAGIKIAPGERIEGGFSREFLGYGRECREQILWFNCDVVDGSVTLIDKQKTFIPKMKDVLPKLINIADINAFEYLLEPHAALIRGDLTAMYAEHDIAVFDRSIAYGLSQQNQDADWFPHFRILSQESYSRRRLQELISTFQWNRLTEIKKRGFPIEPQKIQTNRA
jgi:hypothetical protein